MDHSTVGEAGVRVPVGNLYQMRRPRLRSAVIKLRAERRAGELLAGMAEAGDRDVGRGGDRKSQSHPATVKLSDLGVSRSQASRWQQSASLPEPEFEAWLGETKAGASIPAASAWLR